MTGRPGDTHIPLSDPSSADDEDVLGSSRTEDLWSSLPQRRRSMLKVAAVVLVGGAVTAYGVVEGRGWLRQHALEDTVSLTAVMNVSASSTTPTGGRVDFFLTFENTGRLPVSITAVEAAAPRLEISGQLTGRGFPMRPLQPSQVARVPLSVQLDCQSDEGAAAPVGELRAAVQVVPMSGRGRSVELAVGQGALVTDIADTLCTIDPRIDGDELDGPVALP